MEATKGQTVQEGMPCVLEIPRAKNLQVSRWSHALGWANPSVDAGKVNGSNLEVEFKDKEEADGRGNRTRPMRRTLVWNNKRTREREMRGKNRNWNGRDGINATCSNSDGSATVACWNINIGRPRETRISLTRGFKIWRLSKYGEYGVWWKHCKAELAHSKSCLALIARDSIRQVPGFLILRVSSPESMRLYCSYLTRLIST